MAITDFGESTVLLATSLAASGWFWLSGQRKLAAAWLLAIGGCAVTMLAVKLAFLTCGHLVLGGAIATPSGHSSMSALLYGAAALTVTRLAPPLTPYRTPLLIGAVLFALLIGASRVLVGAHTPEEVAAGLVVGFVWLKGFALMLDYAHPAAARTPGRAIWMLALLYVGLLAFTMSGRHLSVERLLGRTAQLLQMRWEVCLR